MTIVRLTEATWKARELDRVRSILRHQLDRTGIEQDKLARLLKRYLATEYTPAELLWFRDQLVAEGAIEVDGGTYVAAIRNILTRKSDAPEEKSKTLRDWFKRKK